MQGLAATEGKHRGWPSTFRCFTVPNTEISCVPGTCVSRVRIHREYLSVLDEMSPSVDELCIRYGTVSSQPCMIETSRAIESPSCHPHSPPIDM